MESETKVYKAAPMEPALIGVAIFIFASMITLIIMRLNGDRPYQHLAGFMVVLILLCIQYRPMRYEIGEDSVKIIKGWPFRTITIPISRISNVSQLKLKGMTIIISGFGFFALGGWIWNKNIGKFYGAITDSRHAVLITAHRKYAISPEDPDRFVAELRQRAGIVESRS